MPDHFKTEELCEMAVGIGPWQRNNIHDYLKTQKMCGDVVWRDSYSLQFVSDWFVTQKRLEIWHDDDEYCTSDENIEWFKRCKKRKAQKAKIKEELLSVAWYPHRVMDWCMSKDEKRLWR